MRPRLTGLWRHPDFVRLWAGETVSVFGSLVGGAALPFTAILVLDAGPFEVAALGVAQRLPGFLVGLVAGVWVDRLRRRPLMIGADLGRMALLATVPAAALLDVLRIEQLYAVAFLAGVLTVFFDVAYHSYLPSLVRREELIEGNSKLAASASAAEAAGFGLAGWLVQVFTAPVAVLIDALSFLASAVCVGLIRAPEPPPAPASQRRSVRREIRDGLTITLGHPVLRALLVSAVLLDLTSGMVGPLILLYGTRDLGLAPGPLSMAFAVGGVTSLLGALIAGTAVRRLGIGRALILSLVVWGLGGLLIPLARGGAALALLVGSQVVSDPAYAVYDINALSLRQSLAPDGVLGRVNASIRFVGLGAMVIGSLAAGLLGGLLGLRPTLVLGFCGIFLAAGWLLRSPVRRLRELPAMSGPLLSP